MKTRLPLFIALLAAIFLVTACQKQSSSLSEKRVVKLTIPGCS